MVNRHGWYRGESTRQEIVEAVLEAVDRLKQEAEEDIQCTHSAGSFSPWA